MDVASASSQTLVALRRQQTYLASVGRRSSSSLS